MLGCILPIPTLGSEFQRQCYTVRPCLKKKVFQVFPFLFSTNPHVVFTMQVLLWLCSTVNLKREATIPVCSVVSWNVCACYTWLYFAYFCSCWSRSYRFNRLSQTSPCLCLHYTVNWAQSGADPGLLCSPSSPSLLGMHSLAPFKIHPFPAPLHSSAM